MLYAFECDELKNPDANFPGSFRQYCVTMDLEHLPLTGIKLIPLKASLLTFYLSNCTC